MLDVIRPSGIDAEAESLEEFYESVRRRVKGAESHEARQKIVAELYDKFFRNAFTETSKQFGHRLYAGRDRRLHPAIGRGCPRGGVRIRNSETKACTFLIRSPAPAPSSPACCSPALSERRTLQGNTEPSCTPTRSCCWPTTSPR